MLLLKRAIFSDMRYSKNEIIKQLEEQSEAVKDWFLKQPIEQMEFAPENAWTAGQHLLHLIKSTRPLGRGMRFPRFLLRLKFGKVKHESRSFEAVVQAYQDSLSRGGEATGDYVPRAVRSSERDVLLKRFQEEMSVLTTQIGKWSEENLDNTNVPHPLIGNITLREMLYFTIYHTGHHLKVLEERYS